MERVGRRGYRGVVGGRGALASLRRARAPPHTLAGQLHDGESGTYMTGRRERLRAHQRRGGFTGYDASLASGTEGK
jgi:hypothetical protein